MSPSLLQTFANYHNVDSLPTNEPHKIAFAIPGLVFGMNYDILDCITEIARRFNRATIDLYVYSWKTSYNLPFLDRLNKLCKEDSMYPKVNLKYISKTYEETNLLNIAHQLMDDIGVKRYESGSRYFDHIGFKRLVYFYVHHLTFQFIYHDLSKYAITNEENVLVFKLSPKLKLAGKPYVHSSFNSMLYKVFTNLPKHLSPEDLELIKHPYDVLHLTDASSSSFDDLLYASSPHTLVNIFGNSEEEFYNKLLSFYTKYIDRYPGNIVTDLDLVRFNRNPTYFPLEGSTIMKHFADNSKHPVVHQSCRFLGDMINKVMEYNNPWYHIEGDKILPPPELQGDKYLRSFLNFEQNQSDFIVTRNKVI